MRISRTWLTVGAITLVGLALRIAAARGALWLDEAWSAVFARDVGTPLGVFLTINHDNNHHLNSLWLQFVGFDASPMAQRALSIASGAAAIPLAAWFAHRRGPADAIVAAMLFALSPILVTYGAEARGYAPMLLALLAMVALVDRWLADPAARPSPVVLAAVALGGVLSQLTFVFGLAAVTAWVALAVWRRRGFRTATVETLRILGPALALASGFVAFVLLRGLTFGAWLPFTWRDFGGSVAHLIAYSVATPTTLPVALTMAAAAGLAIVARRQSHRASFYLLAIIVVPLIVAAMQTPNSNFPRYLLLVAVALLLLAAEVAGDAWRRGGLPRLCAVAAVAMFAVSAFVQDAMLIADRRGDPACAIAAMRARSPGGAAVDVGSPRSTAVLDSAAATVRYPLRIAACPRFLFIDGAPSPATPRRCGRPYRPIAAAHPIGLSGFPWTLYERAR